MRRWTSQADLGVLVGQVQHTAAECEFGVPDAAVGHQERFADDDGAQRVDVPIDRLARVGDGEVGQRARPRQTRGGGRLGQLGDGGIGAAHFNSFGPIGQVQRTFQS